MVPPTFESNHSGNTFTTRLLLHHFLSENDIKWLSSFEEYQLSDAQKTGLIFLLEVGAIDNSTYRQLNGYDVLKASSDLRILRDFEILEQKGKGRFTYYVNGNNFKLFNHKSCVLKKSLTPQISNFTNRPNSLINGVQSATNTPVTENEAKEITQNMPSELIHLIEALGKRSNDKQAFEEAIIRSRYA